MATRLQRKKTVTEFRRKQVLDAALAVFSRKGYGEATIPEIARQGGMSVGTIYNYYPSKREILVAVLAGRILTEPFLKLMEQSAVTDDRQFFRSLVEERLNMLGGNADKLLFMLNEVIRDEEPAAAVGPGGDTAGPREGREACGVEDRVRGLPPHGRQGHRAGAGRHGHRVRRAGHDRG